MERIDASRRDEIGALLVALRTAAACALAWGWDRERFTRLAQAAWAWERDGQCPTAETIDDELREQRKDG